MIVCYIRCIYVKLENLLSLDLVSSDMLDQTTPALLESPPRKLDSVLLQTNWPTCLPTYVYRTYRASNKERNGSQSADFFCIFRHEQVSRKPLLHNIYQVARDEKQHCGFIYSRLCICTYVDNQTYHGGYQISRCWSVKLCNIFVACGGNWHVMFRASAGKVYLIAKV